MRRESRASHASLIRNTKVDGDARYQVRTANSERTWDGLLAVLADHSTVDLETVRSERWGTDVQGTRCREGEVGHNAFLGGTMGDTQGSPTISTKLQRIAKQAERVSWAAKLCVKRSKTRLVIHGRTACVFWGTGWGKSSRPGLWGGRRVTGAFTRKYIDPTYKLRYLYPCSTNILDICWLLLGGNNLI